MDCARIIRKIENKVCSIRRRSVYNIKDGLLNGIASCIFTPPFCENPFTNASAIK